MTDTANRVLSLEEVLALPDGARVWVEHGSGLRWNKDQAYTALRGTSAKMDSLLLQSDNGGGKYTLKCGDTIIMDGYGNWFRVWSLPQPPTPEEMDANPWEVQDDG